MGPASLFPESLQHGSTMNNCIPREIADYTVRDLYEAETNVGAKSDILRYEV